MNLRSKLEKYTEEEILTMSGNDVRSLLVIFKQAIEHYESENYEIKKLQALYPQGEFFFTQKSLEDFKAYKPLGSIPLSNLGRWGIPEKIKGRHIQIMSDGHQVMDTLDQQTSHADMREMIARTKVFAEAQFELPEIEIKEFGTEKFEIWDDQGGAYNMYCNEHDDSGVIKRYKRGSGKDINLKAYYKPLKDKHTIWIGTKNQHMVHFEDGKQSGHRVGTDINCMSTRVIAPAENPNRNQTRPNSIVLNCFCLL